MRIEELLEELKRELPMIDWPAVPEGPRFASTGPVVVSVRRYPDYWAVILSSADGPRLRGGSITEAEAVLPWLDHWLSTSAWSMHMRENGRLPPTLYWERHREEASAEERRRAAWKKRRPPWLPGPTPEGPPPTPLPDLFFKRT